jgi:hypothetical protein
MKHRFSPREHRWSVFCETGRPIFHCDGIGVKIWTVVSSGCPLTTFLLMIERATAGLRRFQKVSDIRAAS